MSEIFLVQKKSPKLFDNSFHQQGKDISLYCIFSTRAKSHWASFMNDVKNNLQTISS